jgi:toxin ParE1/3/4
MSARKLTLQLSDLALDDLQDIFTYTVRTWGKAQGENYKAIIADAFAIICETPKIGYIKEGIRIFPAEHHSILYRANKTTVYILRVLHERMEPSRHL